MASPVTLGDPRRTSGTGDLAARLPIDAQRLLLPGLGVLLLAGELLYLTFRFDTQVLEQSPTLAAQILGWAPQFLRLATTVAVLAVVIAGKDLLRGIGSLAMPAHDGWRTMPLVAHALSLVAFTTVSASILESDPASLQHLPLRVVAWLFTGTASVVAWSLSIYPARVWSAAFESARTKAAWAVVAGTGVWAGGFVTGQLWTSLARYTFAVVDWILRLLYATPVSDAAQLLVGTETFSVIISPACSGYEGVGLILAFLAIYLWLFRRDLRFPSALLLLPLGAITIWIVNALRIVALVAIGSAGWPEIAAGGFHSQAGWIAFNAVALGFVALTMRGGYFHQAKDVQAPEQAPEQATAAYLGPFIAITATAMLTGAATAGFDWLYPLRLVAMGVVLWTYRHRYTEMRWAVSWPAVATGCVTFMTWVVLLPGADAAKSGWPSALSSVPPGLAATWLVTRGLGYLVAVPIAEELVFRGFLGRRLLRVDFDQIPLQRFSWMTFLIPSVLFGAMHGEMWLAGTMAGMAFAAMTYRRGALGDAVQAHAVTNGLLMLYALTTGHWSAWS